MRFVDAWDDVAEQTYSLAKRNGFHDKAINVPEKIALIHSELSEALEALRTGEHADSKCPLFLEVEVELADAVIRIMDLAHSQGWDVSGAILAKHEYNKTRPYKHGKKF